MVQKMLEQRRNDKFQSMAQVTSNSNSEKTVSPPNQTSTFNPAKYNRGLMGEMNQVDQREFANPEALYQQEDNMLSPA